MWGSILCLLKKLLLYLSSLPIQYIIYRSLSECVHNVCVFFQNFGKNKFQLFSFCFYNQCRKYLCICIDILVLLWSLHRLWKIIGLEDLSCMFFVLFCFFTAGATWVWIMKEVWNFLWCLSSLLHALPTSSSPILSNFA